MVLVLLQCKLENISKLMTSHITMTSNQNVVHEQQHAFMGNDPQMKKIHIMLVIFQIGLNSSKINF